MNSPAFLLAAGSLLLLTLSLTAADAKKTDADLLQGRWGAEIVVIAGEGENEPEVPEESPVQWVFEGDKITFWNDIPAARLIGTFKVDATKTPKTIDLHFPTANEGKGTTYHGIYQFDGESLKLCYGAPDAPRPKAFESTEDNKQIWFVFKRVKK